MWRSSRASLAIENLHTFNFGVAISDHALPLSFRSTITSIPHGKSMCPYRFLTLNQILRWL